MHWESQIQKKTAGTGLGGFQGLLTWPSPALFIVGSARHWAIWDLCFLRSKSQSSSLAKQLLPFSSRAWPRSQPMIGHLCLNLFGNLLIIRTLLFYTWNCPTAVDEAPNHLSSSIPPPVCSVHTSLLTAYHTYPLSLILTAFHTCCTPSLVLQAKPGLVFMVGAQPVSEEKKGSTWHLGSELALGHSYHIPLTWSVRRPAYMEG